MDSYWKLHVVNTVLGSTVRHQNSSVQSCLTTLQHALNDPDREQRPRAPARHDGEHEAERGAAEDGEAEDPLGAVALGQEAAPDVVGRDEAHAVRREQSGLAASGI